MNTARCAELARRTGLPPICAACNLGPCPHWIAPLNEREVQLIGVLRECADYLECIPESAAGGDDEAIRLTRVARAAIAKTQPA
jgi:hypothetical protein